MTREHLERRLKAILAADVAGYGRLTGVDEEGTHVRLKEHVRVLIDPKVVAHRGRVVKKTGDGLLVEFSSAVDAVRCAIEIQRGMVQRNAAVPPNNRVEFRIGVNIGDIIEDDGDIFGDGVNVAARLEAVAEPGGICVSDDTYRQVRDKLDIAFEDTGEHNLKNIVRSVRVFRVNDRDATTVQTPTLALPDKPSIVVLPFQNLSTDPEQEYFADGVVEDITMALSRFQWLFVIARNSSFTYKGGTVDVKQVGRELGVRYVLEGSVRKAGNRLRISGQLIDAGTGAHLWPDRFDGALEDTFDLQDQVTASVVGAIAPKLQRAEIERARRKPTENLNAYDCYLRGIASIRQWTKDGDGEALQLFRKAIELDPDLASAYGMAAWCYVRRKANGWMIDRIQESLEATRLAQRAVSLGTDDPVALCMGGYALAFVAHEFDDATVLMDRGLAINPNFATAWKLGAWLRVWRGEPDLALEHVAHAMRLSPLDSSMIQERDPHLRVSNLKDLTPFRRSKDLAALADGLRKAGIPE